MGPSSEMRRNRYAAKARAELEGLAAQGVVMAGNAFSSVLLVKGQPSKDERKGAPLLSGDDGTALRAALQALGYAPEDWAGLASWSKGGKQVPSLLMREAICALDPATLVACDEPAANMVREAYAQDLASLESFDEAMLAEGVIAHVAGMRVLNLGDFAAALADKRQKQLMWHRLKQIPPLGEPY